MPPVARGSSEISAGVVAHNARMEPVASTRRHTAMVSANAAVAVLLMVGCAGCSQAPVHDSGAPSRSESAPDVRGEMAKPALADLRAAGIETFSVEGKWSAEPVGVVLSQHPGPGQSAQPGQVFRLVVSIGPERKLSKGVSVGLGTCDLYPIPEEPSPCAGGPVLLRPRS